jgi:hypothetical protein
MATTKPITDITRPVKKLRKLLRSLTVFDIAD